MGYAYLKQEHWKEVVSNELSPGAELDEIKDFFNRYQLDYRDYTRSFVALIPAGSTLLMSQYVAIEIFVDNNGKMTKSKVEWKMVGP